MKDSTALSAAEIAALRIFSAGLVFLPFALFHFRKIPRNKMTVVILSAVFGNLLPAFLFAAAITRIDASLAGILNSLTPICVAIIGIFFFKSRISSAKITGVVTGFSGLVLLTLYPAFIGERTISFDNFGYTLLILLATFLYGINVNIVSHYLKGVNPVHVATVSIAFMILPAAAVLWQQDFLQQDLHTVPMKKAIWSSVILGVVGSAVATALFYILVKRAGGLFASLVTYGIPFIALFWGILDGEIITWIEVICLGIILFGVYLANRPEKSINENRNE
jgi:drug/metabolite transporter (DMT)-like permease